MTGESEIRPTMPPRISVIAAMSENRVIGRDGKLPWHLPDDLRHFKQLTTARHVIMGRRTFESFGRPLPDRVSIVVTRQHDYHHDGVLVALWHQDTEISGEYTTFSPKISSTERTQRMEAWKSSLERVLTR